MNASSNHYLRAISSSFSANGSLQKSVGKDDGGVEVCKPSPGVVTAVDSLEGEFGVEGNVLRVLLEFDLLGCLMGC